MGYLKKYLGYLKKYLGYLKKYRCLNPLCWKFIYELQTMNCTNHMAGMHMMVVHMIEIHTMKFKYEILYKENTSTTFIIFFSKA